MHSFLPYFASGTQPTVNARCQHTSGHTRIQETKFVFAVASEHQRRRESLRMRQNLWRNIASQTLTPLSHCVSSPLDCAQTVGGTSLPARGGTNGRTDLTLGCDGMLSSLNMEDSEKRIMILLFARSACWPNGIRLESRKLAQTKGT